MTSYPPRRSARDAAGRRDRPVRDSSGRGIEALLARQPWDILIPHLVRAGADPARAMALLHKYAYLLIEWNRKVSNLISVHDEARIVERHLDESLAPAHWLNEEHAERCIDFGSGAGLPAIPLVIAGVGRHWTLVESRRPKTLFMRKAAADLSLSGIEVVHSRLESLTDNMHIAAYQCFTSRATLRMGPTLRLASQFVEPGGTAFLWKGSGREDEIKQDPSWQSRWEFNGLLGVGSGQIAVARFKSLI